LIPKKTPISEKREQEIKHRIVHFKTALTFEIPRT